MALTCSLPGVVAHVFENSRGNFLAALRGHDGQRHGIAQPTVMAWYTCMKASNGSCARLTFTLTFSVISAGLPSIQLWG
ncbi:hypothetical protein [Lysobacter sp. GCM10012299]|uniref:hypothetical protein n=1 Tax=Lysobacter sp. GCM10012299 TaxID=3317333 RepID=UPI0036239B39